MSIAVNSINILSVICPLKLLNDTEAIKATKRQIL